MAYSRWGESKWFVFGSSSDTVEKENKFLSIMPSDGANLGFTYQQLKANLQECLVEVKKESPSTNEEIEELIGYIGDFLKEIDEKYSSR